MNWKITKIEISNFKAFKNVKLDFEESSLITLDGPNGFGKTSIFDAIELLLTGQIKRICNLFDKVMTRNKRHYEDNLFWNTRSGENDLIIKIQFYEGGNYLTLARYVSANILKDKTLNRADIFSQFKLYVLPDFESNDFSEKNLHTNEFIDEIFGENFIENFCFINYLEQGQNQLLITRVDSRKEALGNLFNITEITSEIEKCRTIERGLNRYDNDPNRINYELKLKEECELLRSIMMLDYEKEIIYKKISTNNNQPYWDQENLFSTYTVDIFKQSLDEAKKLQELVNLKNNIRIKLRNDKIESFISLNEIGLRTLAKFGTDINNIDSLDVIRNEINNLIGFKSIILKGASLITIEYAQKISYIKDEKLNWLKEQIIKRDEIQKKNDSNSSIVAELLHLKEKLIFEHLKLQREEATCPLCGADWKLKEKMLEAISIRSKEIADHLNDNGEELLRIKNLIDEELKDLLEIISKEENSLNEKYNPNLHNALEVKRAELENLLSLDIKLKKINITLNYPYTEDENIVNARFGNILSLIRANKEVETEILPSDWQQIINNTFNSIEDFYKLEDVEVANKIIYIQNQGKEASNRKLQACNIELEKISLEKRALQKALTKIRNIRIELETVEKSYAEQTISEIELIFHIYSGRLIQNYQRGLGLFIESRDGQQLRFLTAEKSEHDAILSMSSGQVCALSLAFFLSLNKVYATIPLILIDDPSQSLDEVNIASLTDLLRCELNKSQLILSSHEDDISSYMRYRFIKGGLSTTSLNMQRLSFLDKKLVS